MALASKSAGKYQPTIVSRCTCTGHNRNTKGAEYQDKTYGKGLRVMNFCLGKRDTFRCTVCGKDHVVTGVSK